MEVENGQEIKQEIDSDFSSKEKQEARSFLRERFLRAVTSLVGKECTFHMHSRTNVDGIFRGNDIEFETLLADKLKTPFAEIPHAKIRSSDVRYITFNNISLP